MLLIVYDLERRESIRHTYICVRSAESLAFALPVRAQTDHANHQVRRGR